MGSCAFSLVTLNIFYGVRVMIKTSAALLGWCSAVTDNGNGCPCVVHRKVHWAFGVHDGFKSHLR